MSNFNERKAELDHARTALDSVIELSQKHRLTSCKVNVVIGGQHICEFEAPVGVVHELVSVGQKAAIVADALVDALVGLDRNGSVA
jgi:hypothetical protein